VRIKFFTWATVAAVALLLCSPLHQKPWSVSAQTQPEYATVVSLLQARQFAQALQECRRLLETAPQLEAAYLRLAEAATEAQLFAEAESYLTQKTGLTPEQDAYRHYALASLYQLKASPTPTDQQQVIEHCLRSLHLNPTYWRPYARLVDAHWALKKQVELQTYLAQAVEQSPQNPAIHYALGYFAKHSGKVDEGLAALDEAQRLAPTCLEIWHERGAILLRKKDGPNAQLALLWGQQYLQLAQAQAEVEQQSKALKIIGLAQSQLSQFPAAIAAYQQGLRLAETTGDLLLQDYFYGVLCSIYVRIDEYTRGLTACRQGLSFAVSRIREFNLANLGVTHRRLGDTATGVSFYQEALQLARQKESVSALTLALTNLGETYAELRKYQESQRLLQEALTLAQRHQLRNDQAHALASLGKLYFEMGSYPQAVRVQTQAWQLAKETQDQEQIGRSLISLGETQLKLRHWRAALQSYQQAQRIGAELQTARLLWQAHSGIAAASQPLGQLDNARQHYRLAIQALEDTRQKLKQDADKISFWQDKVKIYKELIALLLGTPTQFTANADEAFYLAESWRARALLDFLAEARVKTPVVASPALPPSAPSASFNQPVHFREAQARLSPTAAILAYSLGERASFLFVLTAEKFTVHRLAREQVIRTGVNRLLTAVTAPEQASRAAYWREGHALAEQLLGPAQAQIKGKQHLIVVADGALQRLPFQLLLQKSTPQAPPANPADWPYLVKDCALSYSPSVSNWLHLQAAPPEANRWAKDFVAFGAPSYTANPNLPLANNIPLKPLPYSLDEVRQIAGLFERTRVRLYLEQQAREEQVKVPDCLQQARFVHFSVHANVNETAPQYSGLWLATPTTVNAVSSGGEDGLLTAEEIFNLRLSAELVTLSGCETGLGREDKGEGLLGLVRAFIYAGAPSVLVSLWKVDDRATTDLMVQFYKQLMSKAEAATPFNKAEALRQAQLTAIRTGNEPYFWASFILAGRE